MLRTERAVDSWQMTQLFITLTLTLNGCSTGVVEYEEWRSFKTHAIDMYMNDMKEKHPHHRDRFSDQVWLFQNAGADDILRRLRERYTFLNHRL